MDPKQKTTAALIAAVVGIYGASAGDWAYKARLFFGVSKIECEVKAPCPTPLQKYRFILMSIPLAHRVSVATGVPVSAIMGQSALETGFGTSFLWKNHNNGFGIKCSGTFKDCVSRYDTEYLNGQKTGWVSRFRSYQDPAGSFFDYANFLKVNPRYRAAWGQRTNGPAFVREVWRAGYATDPLYVSKVSKIVNGLELTRFDLKPEQWRLTGAYCLPADRTARRCAM